MPSVNKIMARAGIQPAAPPAKDLEETAPESANSQESSLVEENVEKPPKKENDDKAVLRSSFQSSSRYYEDEDDALTHFTDVTGGGGGGLGPGGLATLDENTSFYSVQSSTGAGGKNNNNKKKKKKQLVWEETVMVQRSKIVAFILIIAIGLAVCLTSFYLASADEDKDFIVSFTSYAEEIQQTKDAKMEKSLSVIESLSKAITNIAVMQNVSFPFFTHPHFDVVGGDARAVSGVDVILLAPLVMYRQREDWEEYAAQHGDEWINQGLRSMGQTHERPGPVPPRIHPGTPRERQTGETHVVDSYLPVWQMADAPANATVVNYDLFSANTFEHRAIDVMAAGSAILSEASENSFLAQFGLENKDSEFTSYLMEPVFNDFSLYSRVVAFLIAVFPWATYFDDILQEGVTGLHVVVSDTCGSTFTYMIDGPRSVYLGQGNVHEPAFSRYAISMDFATYLQYHGPPHPPVNASVSYDEAFRDSAKGHCMYKLVIYPSAALKEAITSSNAATFAGAVAVIFAIILIVLMVYDLMVTRRQNRLMETATRTKAIVTDLFPEEIQRRMMEESRQRSQRFASSSLGGGSSAGGGRKRLSFDMYSTLASTLTSGGGGGSTSTNTTVSSGSNASIATQFNNNSAARRSSSKSKLGKPIADLFPETTVFFADIVGFTAWSSAREPSQVFTLLESIYSTFDETADIRRVFKVETVGDCYVAVTGLPQPRKDHAVAMARFAKDCVYKFISEVKELETSLGPDTADLGLRVGLHSGPVTAGVLRGDRARFQLFGDTMNTASRMESTSSRNRVQLSEETARLIRAAGKAHWIRPREEKVVAKGKGEMQTYWLGLRHADGGASEGFDGNKRGASAGSNSMDGGSLTSTGAGSDDVDVTEANMTPEDIDNAIDERQHRLIEWNSECLLRFLKEIEARRQCSSIRCLTGGKLRAMEEAHVRNARRPLEEVIEVITLPSFKAKKFHNSDSIDLGQAVENQMRQFVETIAILYKNNPFHNFEHASHVTMSTIKLLSRIIAPNVTTGDARDLHDHTYGITSDPLTQFACAFSALIHDCDHAGVPNSQLILEGSKMADTYSNKCILEQNSVDLAWGVLMGDEYMDLRYAIYRTEDELNRFRQLVVNSVMATDIMDKDLKNLRNDRWSKAFDSVPNTDRHPEMHMTAAQIANEQVAVNRKATIVIEHLIQASDVAHTMQHWHVYRKWNERLFAEMYKAYKQGRSEKNPAEFWYNGEIGFFDFYIIPLAKKLKECGVFGVSSDEYLNYAERNREEWKSKGKEIVEGMLEKVQDIHFMPNLKPGELPEGNDHSDDDETNEPSESAEFHSNFLQDFAVVETNSTRNLMASMRNLRSASARDLPIISEASMRSSGTGSRGNLRASMPDRRTQSII